MMTEIKRNLMKEPKAPVTHDELATVMEQLLRWIKHAHGYRCANISNLRSVNSIATIESMSSQGSDMNIFRCSLFEKCRLYD